MGKLFSPCAAVCPVLGQYNRNPLLGHFFLQQFHFVVGVVGEMIDRHHTRQPVLLRHVFHVAFQISHAALQRD